MPKICVIQINVVDMDEALDFYCDKLGFEVDSREEYPCLVSLANEGVYFVLNRVEKPFRVDYPNVAQTLINIQTGDLYAAMADLKAKGVEFIHDEPQICPVGIYAAFRDPFGNAHELLEFGGTIK